MRTNLRHAALVAAAGLLATLASGQSPLALERPLASAYPLAVDRGASALWQSLQKLNTRASLMMVVAHPDDEDGGMLAYESRGLGVDATLLTLTRGEGGQNVVTGDFWDELGVLRTQELLAASDAYGVRLRFSSVADFGFSKTLEETFKTWGHERVLYDVVRQVRMERPLVVMSVFAGSVSDGHGHHQASGVLAQEAYKLAGDPSVFPDQIAAGLQPWSPLKVYARVPFARVSEKGIFDYATGHYAPARFKNYATGEWIEGVPRATLDVPEGTYNPLFGESYIALAREGLSQQKTQNDGVGIPPAGPFSSSYHLYASRAADALPEHEAGFFDGIDVSLAGIASYAPAAKRDALRRSLEVIAGYVKNAAAAFDAANPANCAAPLAEGLKATRTLRQQLAASNLPQPARANMDHELAAKEAQFNLALAQSLGLQLVATLQPASAGRTGFPLGPQRGNQPTPQSVIAGQKFVVNLHLANQGSKPVQIVAAELKPTVGDWSVAVKTAAPAELAPGQAFDAEATATVPATAEPTHPYFARPTLEQSYYDLLHADDLGLPTAPYPLSAHLAFSFQGVEASVDQVVQTIHRVNVLGPVLEPLLVAPAVSVTLAPGRGILPLTRDRLDVEVRVRNLSDARQEGTLDLRLPAGWTAQPAQAAFTLTHDGEEKPLHFTVQPHGVAGQSYTLQATASIGGTEFSSGFTAIGYPGLRPYPEARPALSTITSADVKIAPGLRVGYVMGPGDDVPAALQQIGVETTQLNAQDLAACNLSAYDAIVIGIRAYTTRADLRAANSRLLEYVKAGGVTIVQYQTAEFDRNYGPFALSVPGDAEKVVEEDGPVEFDAADPLLSWPNQIAAADFNNWVEERGHGFASTWAPEFHAPTSMHDTDQDPQRGGLLWARSGKGIYIYAAYAFFREMPEGVPGSFRIMANLLSAGKNAKARD
jgi:LmbE family N-acetylglucosaminyl deacetylase